IQGAALVRLLDARAWESAKFLHANADGHDIGLTVLRRFGGLTPIIMFSTNLATLLILLLGGRMIVAGGMSLGDFAAFNGCLAIVLPSAVMVGAMSHTVAQARTSCARLGLVLGAPAPPDSGHVVADLRGALTVSDAVVTYGGKDALRNVSLSVAAGTTTAI